MAMNGISGAGGLTALPEALMEVYSLDILHKAQGIMRFEEFSVRKQELSAAPGETISFITYEDLALGANKGKLVESTVLSANAMDASKKSITVEEWGNAIKVSEKLLRLSWDDVMAEAATLLGRDYAVSRDLAFRDALATELSNLVYASTGGDAVPTALNEIDADDVLDIDAIRNAVEILETNNAPKFFGDYYVCFVHPHQASYLRRDQDWVNAHQYVGTRNIFNGEIGRFEDVIFVTTTHARNGATGANTPGRLDAYAGTGENNINIYEALMFGDQCVYAADALPVELRDNGVEDFGRTHGLAWYSLFGIKCLRPEYGVKILSA